MSEHQSSIYRSGSLWRRWDPHIHAPGTAKEDRFGGDWEGYLSALETASPRIEAIGVTDYFTTRSYHDVLSKQEQGRLKNVFLFPNVELRVMPSSKNAPAGVNIHLLIDPLHVADIEEELKFLSNQFDGRTFSCTEDSLIRYGRHVTKNSALETTAALKAGIEKFHLEFTTLASWLARSTVVRHTIVAVAAGNDGLSGIATMGALSPRRRELARLSHAIFSSNPADVDYWLGRKEGMDQDALAEEGGVKPCLHGCDAHAISKVGRPDMDRYTWVKADLTFEGLRQTLHEPGERVYIGQSMPHLPDDDRVIESVSIVNGCGWIGDGVVHLNPYLNCIIGARGSGKTALADLVALAAGAWREEESAASFLAKASSHLHDLEVRLNWRSGHVSAGALPAANDDSPTEVQYLSQQFVEDLCSTDRDGTRLRIEVERVVFQHIPVNEREECVDFESLLALRLEPLEADSAEHRESIGHYNQQIHDAHLRETKERPAKELQLKEATKRIVELRRQAPAYVETEHQRIASILESEAAQLEAQRRTERDLRDRAKKIDAQIRAFAVVHRRWQAELDTHVASLKALRVLDLPASAKVPQITELDVPTTTTLAKIASELEALVGQPVDKSIWTTADVNTSGFTLSKRSSFVAFLESKLSEDQSKLEKLRDIHRLVGLEGQKISVLERELTAIADATSRVKVWDSARTAAYIAYFNSLQAREDELERLYKPLADYISMHEDDDGLELYVRRIVEVEAWAADGERMLDLRKKMPFGSREEISLFARTHLLAAWKTGDDALLLSGITKLVRKLFEHGDDILRKGPTRRDLANWVFGLSHIRVEYGIRYNGTSLENLSPGSRGIVLLRLYLDLDIHDNRPLVIDQPEENLDNRSVYELLSKYFRAAKLRRQVIMVTHNPNLVVNTDAEQVIVAECARVGPNKYPSIRYLSGGLESIVSETTGEARSIRNEVCDILEGGLLAFRRRETRYRSSGAARTSSD